MTICGFEEAFNAFKEGVRIASIESGCTFEKLGDCIITVSKHGVCGKMNGNDELFNFNEIVGDWIIDE